MTTALPFQAQQPIFNKVGGISELVHMNEEERLKYNISLDTYRTNVAVMKNERAEGRAEGRLETTIEIAKNLRAMNISIEDIVHATGLDAETIKSL